MELSFLDLRKLRANEWQLVVFSVMATITPSALIILLFKPGWFVDLQFCKLMLLSLAITLPMVVANLLAQHFFINTRAVPLVRKDDAHQVRIFCFSKPL